MDTSLYKNNNTQPFTVKVILIVYMCLFCKFSHQLELFTILKKRNTPSYENSNFLDVAEDVDNYKER